MSSPCVKGQRRRRSLTRCFGSYCSALASPDRIKPHHRPHGFSSLSSLFLFHSFVRSIVRFRSFALFRLFDRSVVRSFVRSVGRSLALSFFFFARTFPVQLCAHELNIRRRSWELAGHGSFSLLLMNTTSSTIRPLARQREHSAAAPHLIITCDRCPFHVAGGSGPLWHVSPTKASKACSLVRAST